MRSAKLFLAGAALLGVMAAGCEDTTNPAVQIPASPTGLMATSTGSTSLRIEWTPPTGTIAGYRITVLDAANATVKSENLTTGDMYDITGLTEGKVYTVRLQTRTTDTVSAPVSVQWAPASRIAGRVYGTSSTKGSGFNFLSGSTLTIGNGSQWDICLDSRVVGGVTNVAFGAPAASTYTDAEGKFLNGADKGKAAKATSIYNKNNSPIIVDNVDSLNQVFDTQPLGTGLTAQQNMAENLETRTKGFVMILKTVEGNYAKVFVKATGGKIVQTGSDGEYIDFEASFQKAPNVAFARLSAARNEKNPPIIKW